MANNELSVRTTAGTIKVYKHTDPDAPGVCVVLQPKGYDFEIDLANIEVKEAPEYMTADCEGAEDVCIYTYGNVYTDEFTDKCIIRRNDVLTALNGISY